jgi:hypothetical protein
VLVVRVQLVHEPLVLVRAVVLVELELAVMSHPIDVVPLATVIQPGAIVQSRGLRSGMAPDHSRLERDPGVTHLLDDTPGFVDRSVAPSAQVEAERPKRHGLGETNGEGVLGRDVVGRWAGQEVCRESTAASLIA